MIDLNQLEQLVCIAENNTLSNASKKLLISQPALSRSMQNLERELGVLLFEHHKNKVILNENGKLVVEHAKKILKDVDRMVSDVKAHDLSAVTIASCTPAPIWDLEPLLKSLYPNTNISSKVLNQNELVELLKENQTQIIITPYEVNDPDIICIPYLDEDLCVSVPDTHPLKDNESIHFTDMIGETMLVYNNIGFWHDIHIRNMPNTFFITQGDRNAFMQIAKSSTFPTFTTNLTIKREGTPENRVVIPFDEEEAHVSFYLNILKKDKNKYKNLIDKIENYYEY